MYIQLDKTHGVLVGYLNKDPDLRHDKTGKRMVVLDVCYDAFRGRDEDDHRHNTIIRMPCVVYDEYTSYARTLQKGDCIIAVGERRLEPPKGFTTNPITVGKRRFGFIGGTGITRAWTSELEAYQKNQIVKELKKSKRQGKKQVNTETDKFSEIKSDWY